MTNLNLIKEPIVLDNILHERDNFEILENLFKNGEFILGVNAAKPNIRLKKALFLDEQHAGFQHNTKKENEDYSCFLNKFLNIYAFVIINQISKRLNFEYKKILRVTYNYYCREQFATEHTDSENKNEFSIVYNPHTTDGGTIILGKKYQDISGQAKIFNSNWLHSSYPVVQEKGRVSLNIKFSI